MRIIACVLMLCLSITTVIGQHQLGLRTDTYTGISGAALNPASIARTPWAWDIQLGGASLFFSNNYGYLEDISVAELARVLQDDATFYLRDDLASDFQPEPNSVIYDFNVANSYYGQFHTSVLGPGFSVQVAPYTRVGISSAGHTAILVDNIDADLGYDQWNSIPTQTEFRIDEIKSAIAAWGEVGLNVSQGVPLNDGILWLGASVRRLWGQRAGYLRSTADFNLEKLPESIGLEGLGFDIDGGFTNNLTNEDVDFGTQPGSGWGIDIGGWYQVMANEDYAQWEFGLALIDLGGIRFTDAQTHRFTTNSLSTVLQDEYSDFDTETGLTPIVEQFSTDVYGDASASQTGESFRMRLATSISGQVRYNFNQYAGVEAVVLTGLGTSSIGLQRKTLLALTPRIDKHWWSAALPVSLYAGEPLRVGLAARLGPIVIGTEDLGSHLGAQELDSTDAYFAVKWFPLGLSNGKHKNRKHKPRRGRGREVECYKF